MQSLMWFSNIEEVPWAIWLKSTIFKAQQHGSVPSSNKPIPEPRQQKANVDLFLCYHMASLGHNEQIHGALVTHICVNTLKLRQNGHHFADDPFKCILIQLLEFQLKFHWSFFLSFHLTIFQDWFRKWLGTDQATSHYLNQWWLDYWRIYALLGFNELMNCFIICLIYGIKHVLHQTITQPNNVSLPTGLWWTSFNKFELNYKIFIQEKCICSQYIYVQGLFSIFGCAWA